MKESPVINKPAFNTVTSFSVIVRPYIDLVFPHHMHPDYQLNLVIDSKVNRVVDENINL